MRHSFCRSTFMCDFHKRSREDGVAAKAAPAIESPCSMLWLKILSHITADDCIDFI